MIKMELPQPQGEKSVEELMKEYVVLQQRYKNIEIEMSEIKDKVSTQITDDYFAIPNVAVFKRKKGSVRKLLDKNLVKNFLEPEQFEACHKTSEVKPSISIMSWDNAELQKSFSKKKE